MHAVSRSESRIMRPRIHAAARRCDRMQILVGACCMKSASNKDYSIPNRNLHSAEDPSTFLVVLSYRWATRRCRGLRPAGIVESAPGVPVHPEGPLSRLLRSSRRLEVEVKK